MSPIAQTAGLALLIGSAFAVSAKAPAVDEGAGRPSAATRSAVSSRPHLESRLDPGRSRPVPRAERD